MRSINILSGSRVGDVSIAAAVMFLLCSTRTSATTLTGACDGSAVVDVGQGYLLNASDEDNVIRLYKLVAPGPPVSEFDLNAFLKPERNRKGRPKEVDIEAVARLENRLYWIGSHGGDKTGNKESSRHRLFATELRGSGGDTTLVPIGFPYTRLLDIIKGSGTAAASALRSAESSPHERGGVDIEGLAATKTGILLVGFRSPLVSNKALIVRITNIQDVVERGVQPRLDPDILLDLNGMGILDIVSTGTPDEFLIVAGTPGRLNGANIYLWRLGKTPVRTAYAVSLKAGSPDAIVKDGNGFVYVAMDGGDEGQPACKDLPEKRQSFRIERVVQAKPR